LDNVLVGGLDARAAGAVFPVLGPVLGPCPSKEPLSPRSAESLAISPPRELVITPTRHLVITPTRQLTRFAPVVAPQYTTQKSKKNTPERIEMKKYNKYLRRHTLHREIK